jgi:hypothetical protein
MSHTPTRSTSTEIARSSNNLSVDNTNDGHNRRSRRGNTLIAPVRQPRFEGRSDNLKGHIYECTDICQADQYTRTTKKHAIYIGQNFKFGMYTHLLIKNMQLMTLQAPSDPPVDANVH